MKKNGKFTISMELKVFDNIKLSRTKVLAGVIPSWAATLMISSVTSSMEEVVEVVHISNLTSEVVVTHLVTLEGVVVDTTNSPKSNKKLQTCMRTPK